MKTDPLKRSLGLKEAMALVVGTTIGTGVFLKAAIMAQQTGAASWVLIAWVVAGLLSLGGALCYAELGAMFPTAGGEYVYLREAYGDLYGFLFGWMRFWIASPGSIAAYAVGGAGFLNGVIPMEGATRAGVGLAMIAVFTAINCGAVALGGRIQVFMTFIKLAMIGGLIASLLYSANRSLVDAFSGGAPGWPGLAAFAKALIAALWAYDGWNNMPMAAGEIHEPGRNLPRALAAGMGLIVIVYCLLNLGYFLVLPFGDVTTSLSNLYPDGLPVAARAAAVSWGPAALGVLSIGFVLSALGTLNGSILANARVPYAMAQDKLFFASLGKVNPTTHVPVRAVVVQSVIAGILALSGTFDQLTDYVVFSSWIFYALTTASLFVLRKRRPNFPRPYRTPGYPWLPIGFIGCALLLLVNTINSDPYGSGLGLVFIAAGVPAFFWFRRGARV